MWPGHLRNDLQSHLVMFEKLRCGMRACVLTTRDLSFQTLTPKLLQDHANFLRIRYTKILRYTNQFLLSFSFMPVLFQLKTFF